MTTLHVLCGLKVAADLPLPDLLPWHGDDRAPDVVIRLGDVPGRPDAPVLDGTLLQVATDGSCRFAIPGVAAYHVDPAGREVTVDVDPAAGRTAPAVRAFLFGTVFAILCFRRGLLPLHASCVRIGGRAIAFAGPSGVGKSTLAAGFVRAGCAVLADDVTVIDPNAPGGPVVLPAFPRLKLWRDAMDGLRLPVEGLERTRAGLDKFLQPLDDAFWPEPLPLDAVYHMSVVAAPQYEGHAPQRGMKAVERLMEAVYRRRLMATLLGDDARALAVALRVAGGVREHWTWQRTPGLDRLDDEVRAIIGRHGPAREGP
ncbi:serine kinase [Azospirillum sp.]|uniref:serine kinase n=1 Tax=Azospirillum sp. TaxID=34012 RepID=UPI002D2E5E27|nr:serine kinase [Azospirillum sp.]HYD69828.1 serine kinase [Azospirillum sp.]